MRGVPRLQLSSLQVYRWVGRFCSAQHFCEWRPRGLCNVVHCRIVCLTARLVSSCVGSYTNRGPCPLANSFLPKSAKCTRSSKKVSRVGVFHSGLFLDKQHPYLEASLDRTKFVKVIRLRAFYCRSLVPWESGWQILSRQKRDDLELSNSRTASNGSLYSYYLYS